MKRIWIAVVLIAISLTLCATEQIKVEKFYQTIYTLADEGNPKELKEYWKEKNDSVYIFSHHDMLDELAQSIEALDEEKNEQTGPALDVIKAIVKVYYENQRITMSNIF
ncbi:MAG TPA: hypothetical protein DCZ02_00885 [Ruminococcaceae bacterium]|nr:hypothetical protein [Oscillospiraceae bacterium]